MNFDGDVWECPECMGLVLLGRGCQACADRRGEPVPCERCGELYGGAVCAEGECLCYACESGDPCSFHGNPGRLPS